MTTQTPAQVAEHIARTYGHASGSPQYRAFQIARLAVEHDRAQRTTDSQES